MAKKKLTYEIYFALLLSALVRGNKGKFTKKQMKEIVHTTGIESETELWALIHVAQEMAKGK